MHGNAKRPLIGISTCIDAGKLIDRERMYQYVEISYADAVAEAGAMPVIIPYLRDASKYIELLAGIDGLIISGGEDLPSNVPGETPDLPLALEPECRLEQDRALLDAALAKKMPLLGICYGMQLLNLHLGGTLYYDIPHQLPAAGDHKPGDASYRHTVRIPDGTLLRDILGSEEVSANTSHHQSIRDLGAGLRVVGTCDDGIIEAIEAKTGDFIIGLQWHPEKIAGDTRRKLFTAFVRACERVG
jgi:putative glutamine amidotransferase